MAFITKANAVKILRKINLNDIPDISGKVYKKPIYFLSKSETKNLLLLQSLLKNQKNSLLKFIVLLLIKTLFNMFLKADKATLFACKICNIDLKLTI